MDARKHFFREKIHQTSSAIPCTFHEKSDFNVSMNCDFIKKWSEYYTFKECEDEVNRKGHLTKLQEAVHVDNFRKMTFNLRNS